MLLLEADGKKLFRKAGIATPRGVRLRDAARPAELPGAGPWIAKAQVPVGGRGKAGGVLAVPTREALAGVMEQLMGKSIKGCITREVLVEEMSGGAEHYLSIMVDAGAGGVRLMYSPHGGVDVESHRPDTGSFNELLPLEAAAIGGACERLAAHAPPAARAGLLAVARGLADLFLERQLLLAEINPLFLRPGGGFVAGDAKVVVDMNVVGAHEDLQAIVRDAQDLYPDAWRKLSEDFDFVVTDPLGQVGLVTTGAGLSMMLIDEMTAQGLSPFNFCDMRTGQMRGSPARLLRIFDWLAEARDVRVILVNIFAGITDLAEFTQLLVDALKARPGLGMPVVARLVGNGEAEARRIVEAHPELHIAFEPDLERAITHTRELLRQGAPHAA